MSNRHFYKHSITGIVASMNDDFAALFSDVLERVEPAKATEANTPATDPATNATATNEDATANADATTAAANSDNLTASN